MMEGILAPVPSCSRVTARSWRWPRARPRHHRPHPQSVSDRASGLDLVNLAVDGYGLGQSLRNLGLREDVDDDLVLLVVVPIRDVWRDLNTIRSLAEAAGEGAAVYHAVIRCR